LSVSGQLVLPSTPPGSEFYGRDMYSDAGGSAVRSSRAAWASCWKVYQQRRKVQAARRGLNSYLERAVEHVFTHFDSHFRIEF
jgi:hypothetical protein